ncbi:hypothetical protein HOG75_00310, partial [bacterium]|nr:hypothetical protein [bacterium]
KCQNYLSDAALIGNIFDFKTLADLYLNSKSDNIKSIVKHLLYAIEIGYLIPINFEAQAQLTNYDQLTFKFAHDRIQQAASLLLNEQERAEHNFCIGQIRRKAYEGQWPDMVFEIVPYYNQAMPVLLKHKAKNPDDIEVSIVAELNLMAACKAKLSVAYEEALGFARAAHSLIDTKWWHKDFDFTKDLYTHLGKLEQINANFDLAEKYFDECLKHLTKKEDILEIYIHKVKLYTTSSQHQKAIKTGLKGLKMLGVTLSENPATASLAFHILQVKTKLGFRKPADLFNLPEMKNEKALWSMRLMISLATTVYQTNQNLGFILVLKMVLLSLKYGNSKDASFSYMAYALALCAALNSYKQGYEFGQLALKLNEKYQNVTLKPIIYELFGSIISHWTKPLRESIPYLKTAYQAGEETGDSYYAALAAINILGESIISGDFLNNICELVNFYTDFIKKQKFANTALAIEIYKTLVVKLTKTASNRINTLKLLNDVKKLQDKNALSLYYIFNLITSYHLSVYKDALTSAQKFAELIKYSRGLYYIPDYYFYYSLTIMSLYQEFTKEEQSKYSKILKQNLAKMKKWSMVNTLPKYLLMAAELTRIQKNVDRAMKLYDQAINKTNEYGFIQIGAIANECKAKFYLTLQDTVSAKIYFLNAHNLYTKWGALAKAQQLEKKYPEMFKEMLAKEAQHKKELAESMLDVESLIKASQAISDSKDFGELIKNLMNAVIENSGAEKAVIILKKDKDFRAEAEFKQHTLKLLQPQPLGNYQDLPSNIIQEIQKQNREIIITNAAID